MARKPADEGLGAALSAVQTYARNTYHGSLLQASQRKTLSFPGHKAVDTPSIVEICGKDCRSGRPHQGLSALCMWLRSKAHPNATLVGF